MTNLKRGVNVSRFLASGNTLSPSSASSTATYPASDDLELDLKAFDEDLAKFTNLEWNEYDLQGGGDGGGVFETVEGATDAANNKRLKMDDHRTGDGSGEADWSTGSGAMYNPFDINTTTDTTTTIDATTVQPFDTSPMAQTGSAPTTAAYHQHQQQSAYPEPLAYLSQPYPSTDPGAAAAGAAAAAAAAAEAASPPPPPQSLDDNNPAARAAAEEDKRRRNTAASARFRVKKKQREQALEKTAEELKAKAQELEQQVGQLQRENEWLRGLVVLKSGEPVATKEEKREGRKDGAREDPPIQVQAKGEKVEVASREEKLKKGYGTA